MSANFGYAVGDYDEAIEAGSYQDTVALLAERAFARHGVYDDDNISGIVYDVVYHAPSELIAQLVDKSDDPEDWVNVDDGLCDFADIGIWKGYVCAQVQDLMTDVLRIARDLMESDEDDEDDQSDVPD